MLPPHVLILAAILFFLPVPALHAAHSSDTAPRPAQNDRFFFVETFHQEFMTDRNLSDAAAESAFWQLLGEGEWLLSEIGAATEKAPAGRLARLTSVQIEMAALSAAKGIRLAELKRFIEKIRSDVTKGAPSWKLSGPDDYEAVYCALYGGRIALEEALVLSGNRDSTPLVFHRSVPSGAPGLTVKGVEIHSGDILLCRRGETVSALVARGNSCPGVYTGSSIVHIEPESGDITVIGATMSGGIVRRSLDEFLFENGHDALLLRAAPDHPKLANDPAAAGRAADYALAVWKEKSPFDPALDWQDHDRYYSEELILSVFEQAGIPLWPVRGRFISPGAADWLASMGVKNFHPLLSSDLEYDLSLEVVAEWRNMERLRAERMNAVVLDALLEGADMGDRLGYPLDEVPLAFLVKGWSMIQDSRGAREEIPAGMGVFDALRFRTLTERIIPPVKEDLKGAADWLARKQGFEPTYRQLFDQAKKAIARRLPEFGRMLKSPAH